MASAYSIKIRGVVQGVGFRPFVYRLARANGLTGWVLNAEEGVEIHLEGEEQLLQAFLDELKAQPPAAASIVTVRVLPVEATGFREFLILTSKHESKPTVRISPDLPVCEACLRELFDTRNRRYLYPYINCTNCGPRYTVIRSLPYDRANTTMAQWPLDSYCAGEYEDPANRRFHAQPVACPKCGPHYYFQSGDEIIRGDAEVVRAAADRLREGQILAIKGLGGYHLVCDARNVEAVAALRTRKYRKEKPFALMVSDVDAAHRLAELNPEFDGATDCGGAREGGVTGSCAGK
jgi:hydrogenase maturation protein HypF